MDDHLPRAAGAGPRSRAAAGSAPHTTATATTATTAKAGPPDLNQLRTFLAVYRLGSFTAAARRLGLSQSTVTAQVRALERRHGRELFERRARDAAALPAADELAARVAEPLDRLAGATERRPSAEPVHLAGPAELLGTLLLPALAPLVADGVRLRVSTGLTDPLLAELRSGRHDLVVSTRRPTGRALTAVPLADEEFVLVAAPGWAACRALAHPAHRARAKAPVGPANPAEPTDPADPTDPTGLADALPRLPLVSYAEDLPIVRRYWRHVFGRRLHAPAAVTVPDLRAVRAAVAAGAGWSVLPEYLCRDALASGALVPLLRPADPPINTAYLVHRPEAAANPHLAAVREHLLAAARHW
ncbi:DNA-binding transcriptional LysR family regulator [Kitasatospora sp. SolWspMP-SS2h]|uniref:LysR family transcriptional regulator n=1 Tax=Kitasatospora sp. SolWspMP-SS2h TaxID=1305729 RepID=UPI000DBA580D|nr:LysR family transcriptional regulator [Kitasatospora sp. SolWspMP-SS2h]RAJ32070.1 DNA-binding transcriptional LysR family regulator [Kitasatospora sp. SolWspMP-SS2h]